MSKCTDIGGASASGTIALKRNFVPICLVGEACKKNWKYDIKKGP